MWLISHLPAATALGPTAGPICGQRAGGSWAGQRAGGLWAGQRAGGLWAGQRAGGLCAGQRAGGLCAGQRAGPGGQGASVRCREPVEADPRSHGYGHGAGGAIVVAGLVGG